MWPLDNASALIFALIIQISSIWILRVKFKIRTQYWRDVFFKKLRKKCTHRYVSILAAYKWFMGLRLLSPLLRLLSPFSPFHKVERNRICIMCIVHARQ